MSPAVLTAGVHPVALTERTVPQPGPGEILVQMEQTVPFTPGHDGVGIVIAVGFGVTSPRLGERVATHANEATINDLTINRRDTTT